MPIPSAPLPMWFPEGHPARSAAAVTHRDAAPEGRYPSSARDGAVSVTGAPWRRGLSTLVRLTALAARAGVRAGTQRRRSVAPEPEAW